MLMCLKIKHTSFFVHPGHVDNQNHKFRVGIYFLSISIRHFWNRYPHHRWWISLCLMVNFHDLSSFFNETNFIYQHDCPMKKTRWSPRIRMQSRKILLWNKLCEQFCTFSPVAVPVHCRLWNLEEAGVQSMGSEQNKVLSGECSA